MKMLSTKILELNNDINNLEEIINGKILNHFKTFEMEKDGKLTDKYQKKINKYRQTLLEQKILEGKQSKFSKLVSMVEGDVITTVSLTKFIESVLKYYKLIK